MKAFGSVPCVFRHGVSRKPSFRRRIGMTFGSQLLLQVLETMKSAQKATTAQQWAAFVRKYRAEMSAPENRHALALLAALSHRTDFSVGCYCEDESHCHRSVLRTLLVEQGAKVE